jgi:hypothetical protein
MEEALAVTRFESFKKCDTIGNRSCQLPCGENQQWKNTSRRATTSHGDKACALSLIVCHFPVLVQ